MDTSEFLKLSRRERAKLLSEFKKAHKLQIVNEQKMREERLIKVMGAKKVSKQQYHPDFCEVKYENYAFRLRCSERSIFIYSKTSKLFMDSGVKVLFGKANDNALKMKIEKAFRVVLARSLIES